LTPSSLLFYKDLVKAPEDRFDIRESLKILRNLGFHKELLYKLSTDQEVRPRLTPDWNHRRPQRPETENKIVSRSLNTSLVASAPILSRRLS